MSATHDVFISHSSQDREVAEAACAALERAGHRCWIAPRDILPGEDYGEAIVDGIRACRIFLLVVSGHSVASPQVRRETERAANAGLAIIPFRIENVLPSKSLEYFISSAHWLDAIEPPLEPHLDYLVKVVERLLAEAEGSTVPPMPLRAAAGPVAASGPVGRRVETKPLVAIVAIVAGTTMGGIAMWRGTAGREPAASQGNAQQKAHSIFTRRATTLDGRKPVRLRAGPALDAETIAIIGVTDIFFVAPRNGDWWPAQLASGTQGFVHAHFVRVIDDEAARPGNVREPAGAAPPANTAAPARGNAQ